VPTEWIGTICTFFRKCCTGNGAHGHIKVMVTGLTTSSEEHQKVVLLETGIRPMRLYLGLMVAFWKARRPVLMSPGRIWYIASSKAQQGENTD
jgi:hypothetical protein